VGGAERLVRLFRLLLASVNALKISDESKTTRDTSNDDEMFSPTFDAHSGTSLWHTLRRLMRLMLLTEELDVLPANEEVTETTLVGGRLQLI
jgi:hypothetical protein